jgi:4-carboxymuconolactone decarboxylase
MRGRRCRHFTASARALKLQANREKDMAKAPPSAKRDRIKAFVPALVDYTNDVVYGDLWERPGLSKRDRSLVTLAALIATYRPEQLESHLTRAIGNGVTKDEITEVITHLAFYAGWPSAMSAAQLAYTVLVENQKTE